MTHQKVIERLEPVEILTRRTPVHLNDQWDALLARIRRQIEQSFDRESSTLPPDALGRDRTRVVGCHARRLEFSWWTVEIGCVVKGRLLSTAAA